MLWLQHAHVKEGQFSLTKQPEGHLRIQWPEENSHSCIACKKKDGGVV